MNHETAPQCGNCRFYLSRNTHCGDCIRFPPTRYVDAPGVNSSQDVSARFPVVEPWRMCGEHRYKETPKDIEAAPPKRRPGEKLEVYELQISAPMGSSIHDAAVMAITLALRVAHPVLLKFNDRVIRVQGTDDVEAVIDRYAGKPATS